MTPSGYSITQYGKMVTCEPRMSAFAEALRLAVTPGCSVIDLGAGPGIFALLACQFGAGSVVAIEADSSVELLRQMAADNGYQDRIAIFQGLSTDYHPASRADVVISDLRGGLPLYEAHIPTIVDARDRLLAPGGALIPARDILRLALAQSRDAHGPSEEPWLRNRFGLNLSAGHRYAQNSIGKIYLDSADLISPAADLVTLDYYRIANPDFSAVVDLFPDRAGTAHGFVVWFDAELAPGVGFSNAPGQPRQVYEQTFFPFATALQVAPGDRIEAELTAKLIDAHYVWAWSTQHFRAGASAPESQTRQSSFLGKVLSPTSLEARSSTFVPSVGDRLELDRSCLSLIDGTRSLGDIAAEMRSRFPHRFATVAEALDHAANLTARYR